MADLSIGDLAAIVTVAGVTIYVLGLVGLAIPVYRTFTDDVATAWYAVSLLPRTVVAGQGVRIWVQWTLAITVVLLLLTTLRSEIVSMGLLALVAIALYPWVGYVAFLAYKRREGWLGNTITLVIAYFGALSVAFAVGLSSDPSLKFPLIYRIPLLFAGSFLIGLRWAIAATPPLPRVVITKQPGGVMEGLPTSTEGHLVVHSDGFWHLFEDNGELLSLPAAQVLDVRVLRKADRSPAKEEGKQTVTRRPWRALIPWRALLIAAVVLGPGFIWGVLRLFSFT